MPNHLLDCPPVLGLLPTCLLDIGEIGQMINITLNCKVIVVNLEIMSSPSSTKAHQIPKVLSALAQLLPLLTNPALSSLKPWSALMNLTPAAVDDVGATTPVSMTTQTLTLESGSRCHHCVLQKDVAARVSDEENIIFLIHFLYYNR